jgi:soluble lytic murein transglycosylase-like protein
MTSSDISALILSTATAYGVDPRLALEVAMQESGLNQSAVSPAGAIGIFQLMPATAADLGVDPTDPTQNIDGGVRYLSQMLSRYGGNVAEALGAYDWGPGNMDSAIAAHGAGWMNYAPLETQDYVQTILGNVGSQYTVSMGPLPGPGGPSQAGFVPNVPTGWNFSTALWIGGAILVGWALFSFLE